MQRFRDGCKLEQIGEQDVALGAKFRARVVLDIREHANGIPKGISSRDGQQNGRFPLPRSPLAGAREGTAFPVGIHAEIELFSKNCSYLGEECVFYSRSHGIFPPAVDGHPPMDITFDMVEGDFVRFQGVWRVQEGRDPNTCRLSYSVVVTPQVTPLGATRRD